MIFVAISATFYSSLNAFAPELDPHSPRVRAAFSPLNRPAEGASADQRAAAARASVDAFHQAMLVAAGLLVVGSAISWFGLREDAPARIAEAGSEQTRATAP